MEIQRLSGRELNGEDDYGSVNTDYGEEPKVFTINQNQRSQKTIIGVHDKSESVFTVRQNTHCSLLTAYCFELPFASFVFP